MTDRDIIARNTRDGHTAWQNAARQLGRSVDSVRGQYDPTYLRSHIWAPTRSPEPAMAMPEDEDDTSSPYPKTPGLKLEIMNLLTRAAASAETIAARVGTTGRSVRTRLIAMRNEGLVLRTDRQPYTWSLTDIGRERVTRLLLGGEGCGMSDAPWMSEDQMRKWGAEFYGKPVADLTREELFFIVYHQAHKSAAADLEFDEDE